MKMERATRPCCNINARGFEQRKCSDDIRLDEGIRFDDGTIHVTFGREVYDCINLVFAKKSIDQYPVADVSMDEPEPGVVPHRLETCEISRVGQRIEHNDPIPRMLPQPALHEIRTDKAGAAGNQQRAWGVRRWTVGYVIHSG